MSRLKPPALENDIGIGCYKTDTEGIGGRIKQKPEEFIVEEVTPEGIVLEIGKNAITTPAGRLGPYLHCTLEKRNWDTMRAVKEIAGRLGISQKRVGYAGTKDKRALTTQRISVYGKTIEDVSAVYLADITLRDFEYEDDGIGLGSLGGNRFTIVVRGIMLDEGTARGRIEAVSNGIASGVPNFFGVQRFGTTRPITHLVGREMVKGNIEGAVMIYLTMAFDEENSEASACRKELAETRDIKAALKNFPRNMGYELAMLNHLAARPGDYAGAIMALPLGLGKMFVHAYQSYVFNRSLSRYIEAGLAVERLPLVGFESILDEYTAMILDEENVTPAEFRIRGMRDYSSKGDIRDCYEPVEGFKLIEIRPDEAAGEGNAAVLRFTLRPGAYATTLLREFMKNEYWK
ncbi:MAG: tRNA pseudouridine(13) synthase TruD [Candidatus Altiarchaeota archaeon]|nr:tRNA pseudouridine(13) synthase TruD [Candidatus Altiarchaeota archaeon]